MLKYSSVYIGHLNSISSNIDKIYRDIKLIPFSFLFDIHFVHDSVYYLSYNRNSNRVISTAKSSLNSFICITATLSICTMSSTQRILHPLRFIHPFHHCYRTSRRAPIIYRMTVVKGKLSIAYRQVDAIRMSSSLSLWHHRFSSL